MILTFKPYTEIRNLSSKHLIIRLTQADFKNVAFKNGKSVLPFFNCLFEKLTIINEEDISFENVSIDFFNCLIPDIQVETITSPNIRIGFYVSFVSGKIETTNLQGIDINNCLTPTSLFLIGTPNVQIAFSKENFDESKWQGLFIQYYVPDGYRLLENDINFNIYDPKKLLISSSFKFEEEFFNPKIYLSYKDGKEHEETIIKGMSLNSLSISGNPAGNVSLENTRIKSWYIYDFSPTGNVSLYSIEPISLSDPENRIGIHNSKLDGVEFDNVLS